MKKYLLILICLFSINLFAQTPTVTAGNVTAVSGDSVVIPINVQNFSNVGAITIKLQYTSSVLSWGRALNWDPQLSGALANVTNGVVTIAWDAIAGMNLSDGKLVDLKFLFNGGLTGMDFIEAQCEIADVNGNIITTTYINGNVSEASTININIYPETINFGNVANGGVYVDTVTISNGTNSTSNLNGNISVSGTRFAIFSGGGSYSILPGEQHKVIIWFVPDQNGTYHENLSITHNGSQITSPILVPLDASVFTPVITVLDPLAGVNWSVGSSQTVTWNSSDVTGNVNIKLSIDGGTTYPVMLTASTANDGTQSITVPDNVSSTCRVKVESVNNTNTYGVNPGIFTISPGQQLPELIAYYPFNQNVFDESGKAHHATIFGNPQFAQDRFGRPDSAMLFDGVDDWLEVNSSSLFPSQAITMCYWVNRNNNEITGLQNYISKEQSFQSYIYADKKFASGLWAGTPGLWSGYYSGNFSVTNLNDWIFYAFTWDNNTKTANVYIDGVLVNSEIETNPNFFLRTSSYPLYIGKNGSANVYHIQGYMDDIRIYNTALVESDVQNLYHENGWTGNPINLVDDYLLLTKNNIGSNDADIYQIKEDGSGLRLLYDDSGYCLMPEANDSGDKMLFASNNSSTGKREVFIYDFINSNVTQLTSNNDTYGSVNPKFYSGNEIWYKRGPQAGVNEWWKMNYDGTGQTQITNWQSQGKQSPYFSYNSNKSKVVYEKGSPSAAPTHEIYISNIDLSNEIQLTSNGANDGSPNFSPNGNRVVWHQNSGTGGTFNIWIMNSDGTGAQQLTNEQPGNHNFNPCFSLDGQSIFYSHSDGQQNDIYKMNIDGSSPINITNTPDADELLYSVTSKVLENKLIAYYPFTNNAQDESGNGNHGTTQGGLTWTLDRFDSLNSAAHLNGTNSYISLPGTWGGQSELTISAWVKTAAPTDDFYAIVSSNQWNQFLHFQVSDNPTAGVGVYTNPNVFDITPAPTASPINKWRHVVLVLKSGESKVYQDGVEYSSSDQVFTSLSNSTSVCIGRGYGDARFFNGELDDIRIYKKALNNQEIQSLYHENGWNGYQGLVAHYPLSGNALDESGNNNNGTTNSGVSWVPDRFNNPTSAASFDGINGYITVPNSSSLSSPSTALSITGWVLIDSMHNIVSSLIDKAPPDNYGQYNFTYEHYMGGRFKLLLNGGSSSSISAFEYNTIPINEWCFIATTWNGSTATFYLDGSAIGTYDVIGTIEPDGNPISIGWQKAGTMNNHFKGNIDDIRIYNTALTETEIQQLYHENGWTGNPYTGPTWYVEQNGNDTTGTGSLDLPFQTFNKAISVANNKDSILIGTGTFNENINIHQKDSLYISGKGQDSTIFTSGIVLTDQATYNRITNLTVGGFSSSDYNGCNYNLIENCKITGQIFFNIHCSYNTFKDNLIVSGSYEVYNNYGWYNTFTGNYFKNGTYGIHMNGGGGFKIYNNTFENFTSGFNSENHFLGTHGNHILSNTFINCTSAFRDNGRNDDNNLLRSNLIINPVLAISKTLNSFSLISFNNIFENTDTSNIVISSILDIHDNYEENSFYPRPGIDQKSFFYDEAKQAFRFTTVNDDIGDNAHLWIEVDKNLIDVNVIVDNQYRVIRDTLVAQGKLNPPLTDTEEYKQSYVNNILYYQNGKWVKRDDLNE